ncbi:MAG: ion transporter [Bacteroidetes bacterium]|nr:ion transporter [Bacteroidota bacterium]
MDDNTKKRNLTKEKIHEIIFEADTPAGKFFDVALLITIVASVLVVMLESTDTLQRNYKEFFTILEWIFTIIFTIEYILRLYCVYRPMKYAVSFFGIIDLLAILPTYLSLFIIGTQYLLVIRALRLLRVFRIFKLGHYMKEGAIIVNALKASRTKITVFLFFVLLMVTIIGSLMYLVEGGQNEDFDNIPRSIYWSIVTLTTVGYGDITPQTNLGQFLSSFVMIIGYAVIAVPTGIVSAEFAAKKRELSTSTQACRFCGSEGHDNDAKHCKYCGEILDE